MKYSSWVLALALAIAAFGFGRQQRKAEQLQGALRTAAQQTSKWKARYSEAVMHVRHDSVRVTKWIARYDTVRDGTTVTIRDTVWIPRDVADSVANSCRELVTSCSRLKVAADSTIDAQNERIRLLSHNQRKWYDRCGFSFGVGQQWGVNHVGPVATVGCRLFP